MAPYQLTNNFLKRFIELGEYLKTADVTLEHFETFDPVDEESIEIWEKDLNIKFDETFLAYFRESDGYELQYSIGSEDVRGSIMIPAFEDMLYDAMEVFDSSHADMCEILGGRSELDLRSNMYCFDRFDEDQDGLRYYGLYYLVTDNVLLQTNDYNACITDDHPITVPSYFELCLAMAGLTNRRQMLTRMGNYNFKIVDFTRKDYEKLYPWDKSIALAKKDKNLVSKAFYDLTNLATEGRGYNLRFMKYPEV